MKFGYISNNLSTKINNYLNNKAIEITYKKDKPIDPKNINEVIQEVVEMSLSTILIDGTCFYTEQLALEFCYELKIQQKNTRIILISFTKKLLSEIAMLGIYDIIYYEKNIDLSEKLDALLLHHNSLRDIDEYLNLAHIKSNVDSGISSCEIVLFASLDVKTYTTTCALKYAEIIAQIYETCYVEGPNTMNKLSHEFQKFGTASTANLNCEKFNYMNYDIIFDGLSKWKKENVLNILLNVKTKYQYAVIDIGCIENIDEEVFNELTQYKTKLVLFDTDSNRRNSNPRYHELKNMLLENNDEVLYVNPLSIKVSEKSEFDKEFCHKFVNIFSPILPNQEKQEKFKFFDMKFKFAKGSEKIKN